MNDEIISKQAMNRKMFYSKTILYSSLLPLSSSVRDDLDRFLIRKHISVTALESELGGLKETRWVRLEWELSECDEWVSDSFCERQEKRLT